MDASRLNGITNVLSLYIPLIILIFGNIGSLLNMLIFQSKELRRNPCGWYFLMSSVTDIFLLNFGLITKLSSDHFGNSFDKNSEIYCKIRIYLTWTFPCLSTGYLVLASLDRCLSTSNQTSYRSFSRIKVAYRMTIIPIIIYSLTNIHLLLYFNLRPKCLAQSGIYSIFLSIYSIIWTSLIPQCLLLIFGLITYRHIHLSRQRLLRINQSQTNIHLIKMTLFQVIIGSILLNIRTIYYAYYVITTNQKKNEQQIALELLLYQVSTYFFFMNFTKTFYLNTITSKLFRQILIKRLHIYFNRFLVQKRRRRRIHPISTRTI